MFLKRIDLIGFKSFADKTVLEFSPGVTAVVGPNGSGKSNIADAIRWVLGEQSARTLRGSKMEDVIFAGSESRRPINFCEVSLTLDNSDRHLPVVYDEVVITRRVYRSGESEYLLNRQPCRLKDITELFMDSGLGRESYSIIGQGRIEEMLSTRPEDRRGPFEDAAGIVKFKFRRKEAERKLEETEANLVRIDDIVAELERQAEPLQAEAERAAEWKRIDGALAEIEISLLVREIDDLGDRLRDAAAQVDRLEAEREQAARQVAEREAGWQEARQALESRQQALDALQRRLLEAVEERERSEGQLTLYRERIEHGRAALADRAAQRQQIVAERDTLREELAAAEQRLATVSAQAAVKSAEAEAAAGAMEPDARAEIEARINELNAELIEAHHEAATQRNEAAAAERSAAVDEQRAQRLEADLQRWREERERLAAEVQRVEEAGAACHRQLDENQAALDEAGSEVRRWAEEEAEYAGKLQRLQADAASLQSRLDILRELNEGYDGYQLGVKTVLTSAAKGRLKGVHGALATLLDVPREYETAIETALGAGLQNIVVDTEADARAAIDMLKQRRAGRATFMPLDVVRPRRLAPGDLAKVQKVPGFVGVASDLARFDERYRAAVEHLLGNVIVARQLVDANALARRLDYRVRIVTLEGDVVSPGGVMSGGHHVRRGPGLLGRQREQRDVEAALAERRSQAEQVRALQHEARQRMEAATARVKALEAERGRIQAALSELAARERELAAQRSNVEERIAGLEWELTQLADGRSTWAERAEAARVRLAEAERRVQEIESALAAERARLQAWEREAQRAQEALTALRIEAATLAQEAAALRGRRDDLQARLTRLDERDKQLAAEEAAQAEAIAEAEAQAAAAEQRLAALANEVAELEGQMAEQRSLRLEAEQHAAAAEREVRAQRQALVDAEERLRRAQSAAERADLELQHALRRLGERYRMTYEWAKEHHPPVDDPAAARRRADALRRELAALGEVRLGAIEEWQRLRERMEFLQRERTDLEEAKAKLREVIQEIDEEMARRFQQTFAQIREEFQVMFRVLFGGGQADLTLTDPDDPLHAGIEVSAQPPGKKLQNLNLLSGGERALTAMALLFAILRVRPVPFCVLDEVEAALDEANVSRFAQQLRRFADETQFIVITHRRGTMEEADMLYGVTMQESGVSSLVSVRLGDGDTEFETA